jgi:hypothetical protein
MPTSVVERTLLVEPPAGVVVSEDQVHANSFIQSSTQLSLGSQVLFGWYQSHVFSGGIWTINPVMYFIFYVSTANDATIVSGIAGLQASLPGWTIITYSRNMVWN